MAKSPAGNDTTNSPAEGKQKAERINRPPGSFYIWMYRKQLGRRNLSDEQKTYLLNHPYQGLLIDTGIWRTLDDFSSGAVCLVLASQLFEESDYIREYDEYKGYVADKH